MSKPKKSPPKPVCCFWLLEEFPTEVKQRVKLLAMESGRKTADTASLILEHWFEEHKGHELETLQARIK